MAKRGRPKTRRPFNEGNAAVGDQGPVKPKGPPIAQKPRLSEFQKVITKEDTTRILDYLLEKAKKTKGRYWTMNYLLVLTILRTGLRAGELGKLRVDDCFMDRNPPVIKIAGKMRQEWEKDEIYVPRNYAYVMQKWIEKECPRRFVFENRRKKGIDRVTVWVRMKKIFKALRMSSLYNVHSLRHRFGTDTYIASNKDIEFTRRQLRHKNVQTTSKYIHFAMMEKEARAYLANLEAGQEGRK